MERHFGELGFGSGRSSSSRKGKKSNSDKPKQPQRGLGVAQLEQIRLQSEMASYVTSHHSPPFHSYLNKEEDMREDMTYSQPLYSTATSSSSHFGLHPNHMMQFGEGERPEKRYGEFPSSSTSSFFSPHYVTQQTVTLPLLEDTMEKRRRQDRRHSTGSSSQNSDSSETQELDLDLKLSL